MNQIQTSSGSSFWPHPSSFRLPPSSLILSYALFLQQPRDVRPQLGECPLLLSREPGQLRLVAEASQITFLLPLPQCLHDGRSRLFLVPGRELGLQPVERQTAELRLRCLVERRLILTLSSGRQGGGAG